MKPQRFQVGSTATTSKWLLLVGFAVVATGVATQVSVLLLFGVLLSAFGAWGGWWVVVVADATGVTVRNFRRHFIAWKDLDDLGMRSRFGGPTLVLVTGKRQVPCLALAVNYRTGKGGPECEQAEGASDHCGETTRTDSVACRSIRVRDAVPRSAASRSYGGRVERQVTSVPATLIS